MKNVIDYLFANWEWIGPIAYELAVRLFPTQKDLSIINLVKRGTDLIPNRHADGGVHK